MSAKPFHFKQFIIQQDACAMKVGTDGVLLGAWCHSLNAKNILDIGTGTGVIAIMQAQRNENAEIMAVEIDEKAAQQAKENFQSCKWSERLMVFQGSIQDFVVKSLFKFDHIISNPPFYTSENFTKASGNQRLLARNTESLNYSDLVKSVQLLLSETGKFSVIIPSSEMEKLLLETTPLELFLSRKTWVQPTQEKTAHRVLLEFSKVKSKLEENVLVIQKGERNDFTEDYIQLTKSFYTIL
jgi:tRNA1Val (adenine37-N6)-methyltransferase